LKKTKFILGLIVIILPCFLAFLFSCKKTSETLNLVKGEAKIYPALPGNQYRSDRYLVSVSQNGTTLDSYVYFNTNPLDGDGATKYMSLANHFTTFSFSGEVVVKVTLPLRSSLASVEMRPLNKKVTATTSGNVITFSLTSPGNYYLFVNGEEKHPLFIFANKLEVNPPAPAGDPNITYLEPGNHTNSPVSPGIYYFKPGMHDIGEKGSAFQNLPSGVTIYLAGGAFVRGRFESTSSGTLTVRGRGVLSGINIPHVIGLWANFMIDAYHGGAIVEGIVLSDAPQDNIIAVTKSSADNVKILSWHWFTEGIGFFGWGSTISNSFFKTPEDMVLLFTSDMVVKDNVFYQDGSSPLQLGWNSKVDVNNVVVDGVDIVGSVPGTTAQGPGGYTSPNMPLIGLRNNNGANYKGITISNVRCDVKAYMLIFMQLKASYPPGVTGTGGVDGITFRNINIPIQPIIPSLFDGNGSNPGDIKNITFENVVIGGEKLTEQNASKYITRSGNTSGFTYR
jgi:uncharacterized membrane protein